MSRFKKTYRNDNNKSIYPTRFAYNFRKIKLNYLLVYCLNFSAQSGLRNRLAAAFPFFPDNTFVFYRHLASQQLSPWL